MVPGLAKLPYELRLERMKLPSLVFRRIRGDAIKTFKSMQHNYSVDSECLLPRWRPTVSTRGHELRKQKGTTSLNYVPTSVDIEQLTYGIACQTVSSPQAH